MAKRCLYRRRSRPYSSDRLSRTLAWVEGPLRVFSDKRDMMTGTGATCRRTRHEIHARSAAVSLSPPPPQIPSDISRILSVFQYQPAYRTASLAEPSKRSSSGLV